jgi:hypothetical protein
MALFTDEQLHAIRAIIRDQHNAFIVNTIGPDAVPPDVLEHLRRRGLVAVEMSAINDAYTYGQHVADGKDPKIATMSFDAFNDYMRKNPLPLGPIEQDAVQMAKHQAAQLIVGLGNRVEAATGQLLIEADAGLRSRLRGEIRTKTAENLVRRESVKQLKSDLGWASKDWARDWDRIAITEKHTAMQRGLADHYARRFGPDTRVAKRPMPNACEHCKRLHLGPDGQPRIFKLSDLEANGTNFRRRASDWLPVVGATHPHCQCQLVRVPAGWGFDEEGDIVPGGELGIEYEGEEDLFMALRQEMDLQKAFRLAGNIEFQGLKIAVENRAGSSRTWKDQHGNTGTTRMLYPYGYIKRTTGADEDEVDVYVGPDPRAKNAYVVHQLDPRTGMYDEDKVMLGFSSAGLAKQAYLAHYDQPAFFGGMSTMAMDHFKRWIHGSAAAPGEGTPKGTRLVIPLEKAELKTRDPRVDGPIAAQTSRAGHRNPGRGTVVNFVVGTNRRPPPTLKDVGYDPEQRDLVELHSSGAGLKLPRETFDFAAHLPRATHATELPGDYYIDEVPAPEELKERQRKLVEMTRRNLARPRNLADPDEDTDLADPADSVFTRH